MILTRTTALCNRCGQSHPAELRRNGDAIEGVVHCPAGDLVHAISADADLFLELRNRSATDLASPRPSSPVRHVLNYISITDACDFQCAVCGANAKTPGADAVFLPPNEILQRARQVRECGGRLLHLFGGEPTLHPDLLAIVRGLCDMGFSTGLVTNGFRLGTSPDLARDLKHNGLARICLQFDSLDRVVLERLGRDHLEEKLRAIRHAVEAGLAVGLNCTVTKDNLHEVADLLIHGLEIGAAVKNMTFASAAPVGRYLLASAASTDREAIVRALLRAGERYGFSLADILPLPAFAGWGVHTHPDCGVHLLLVRTPAGIQPLNRFFDLPKFYRLLGQDRSPPSRFSIYVRPVLLALRTIRPGRLGACIRIAIGLLMANPRFALVNIGISNYRGAVFLDEQRLIRCSSAFYTSVGPIKGCCHFILGRDAPGSKAFEEARGLC